jgi:hypothetical protein
VYFMVGDGNPLHHLAKSLRDYFDACGGEVVWDGAAFHPRAGQGRFLRCGAPTLRPARKDLP